MAKGGGAEIGPTRLLGVDDEGQILALLGREGFCRMTHLGKSDSALRPCLDRRRHDECTLSVELNRAERTELAALLSGGKHAARKLERAQILFLAADAGGSVRWSGSTRARSSSSARCASGPDHVGTDRALRLRVSAQWRRKPVRLPRRASLLVQWLAIGG